MKRCPDCRRELPLSNFCKNASTKDGHACYCRECMSQRYRVWLEGVARKREVNRPAAAARARRHRERNLAAVRAKCAAAVSRMREELRDGYVTQLLCRSTTLQTHSIPRELIAMKREQLRVHRLVASLELAIEGEPK